MFFPALDDSNASLAPTTRSLNVTPNCVLFGSAVHNLSKQNLTSFAFTERPFPFGKQASL